MLGYFIFEVLTGNKRNSTRINDMQTAKLICIVQEKTVISIPMQYALIIKISSQTT